MTLPYLSCELWRKPRGIAAAALMEGQQRLPSQTLRKVMQTTSAITPTYISIDKSMIGNMEEEG